jgi:hypothetical protein
MSRTWWIAVLLCAALLSASGAVVTSTVLASDQGATLAGPGQIRITSRQVLRTMTDLGPPGPSPGDLLVLSALVFNRGVSDRALGHYEMACTYLGRGASLGGGSRSCSATFFLPRGKIVVQGMVHNMLFYDLVVLGGTGLYTNVQGTLTITFLGGNPRRELHFFRLLTI